MDPRDYAVGDFIGGSYRVLRVFGGAGVSGMGVVYLVDERDAPQPFVLKACQGGDSLRTSRFKREAEVWVSIGSHPNITKAIWVRYVDEQLFVAAEYVGGTETGFGSLADVRGANVGPIQIIRWAIQFCSGLGHALARGLLAHRDVKPANLLLTREGDLKIADFGLGKSVPASAFRANRSAVATTGITGTPPYMAPEQIVGNPTDHRCDIYAFGIVLYELCSGGAYPYEMSPPVVVPDSYIVAHLRGAVRPLANPFWPVINKCLARSAHDRWQTPEELASAVRKIAAQMGWPCPPFVAPQPIGLEELYAKAQSLVALGRAEDALAAIEQYLSEAPDAFWAWTEKGRILMALERNDEAEQATRRSLTLDSGSHAWNNLGLILQRQTRFEESCSAYDRALECDPLNTGAMMNAAQPLCELGRHDRAATYLSTALKLVPTKQDLLATAGNHAALMLRSRAFDPAERVAEAMLTADGGNSQAWHNLGVIHSARGKPAEALRCLRNAALYDPENPDTLLFLARLCMEGGFSGEAITHLDHLIGRRQHLSKSVCFKAQLLAHEGRGRDAIALLERFLVEMPTDDAAWFILSGIAEAEGDIHKALHAACTCESTLQMQGARADSDNVRQVRDKVRRLRAQLKSM